MYMDLQEYHISKKKIVNAEENYHADKTFSSVHGDHPGGEVELILTSWRGEPSLFDMTPTLAKHHWSI